MVNKKCNFFKYHNKVAGIYFSILFWAILPGITKNLKKIDIQYVTYVIFIQIVQPHFRNSYAKQYRQPRKTNDKWTPIISTLNHFRQEQIRNSHPSRDAGYSAKFLWKFFTRIISNYATGGVRTGQTSESVLKNVPHNKQNFKPPSGQKVGFKMRVFSLNSIILIKYF